MAQEIATDTHWGAKAFPHLRLEQREQIKPFVKQIPFPAKHIICRQGVKDDTMYFIEAGTVRFYTYDLEGKELFIRTLGEGDFFGEVALLTGQKRSLMAQAVEEVVAWELHAEHLDTFLGICPEMTKVMLEGMAHRLRTSGNLFANVRQQIEANRTWAEQGVQKLVRKMGTLGFAAANVVLLAVWIGVNRLAPHPLDSREYSGLGLVATFEALFVAILVLAKQNRDEKDNNIRTEYIVRSLTALSNKLLEEDKKIEAVEQQILEQTSPKSGK